MGGKKKKKKKKMRKKKMKKRKIYLLLKIKEWLYFQGIRKKMKKNIYMKNFYNNI